MKNRFELNINRISYALTNNCNLFCKHCFQNKNNRHAQQLSIEDALLGTEFIIKYNKNINKNIEVTLIGGEPVLYENFEELKKCFDLLFNNGYTLKILRIFTNGTLYPNKLREFLQYISNCGFKKSIHFYLTKDFLEKKPTRINKFGESSNNIIDKTKEEILKDGYKCSIQYIFTKIDVVNYKEILEKIYKDKSIYLDYGYPCKDDIDCNDFNYMLDCLYEFSYNHNITKEFLDRCGMRMLRELLCGNNFCTIETSLCDPIKGEFTISPKGYVIPCIKLLEKENEYSELTIKNITNNPNLLFENKKILNLINYENINYEGKKCSECIMQSYCVPCRLFPSIIDLEQKSHINHPKEKCDRVFMMYSIILEKIKEEKWLELM